MICFLCQSRPAKDGAAALPWCESCSKNHEDLRARTGAYAEALMWAVARALNYERRRVARKGREG